MPRLLSTIFFVNKIVPIKYTVANEIVRTPKKNAVKRKQKDQFCSNWF